MAKKDNVKKVEKFVKKLFSLIGVDAETEVYEDKQNEAIKIDIKSENEVGLLIGKRGDTLFSIQSIVGLYLKQLTGDWVRVIVNVGDWREKEEQYLRNLATTTAERATSTKEPQELYNLNPSQRRIVHMALSEIKQVSTSSQGEGKERYLIVSPKDKK